MQITLKPLKGEVFKVDVDEDAKVIDLKNKIGEVRPEFAEAKQQKLIYAGKILTDDSTIKDAAIKSDGFVVIMMSKAAPAPAAAAPAAATAPAAGTTPAAATPAPATAPAAAPAAAANLPSSITDLKNNPRFPDLAMVVTRMPEVLDARMLPALRPHYPELAQAIEQNKQGFLQFCAENAGARGGAEGGGLPGLGGLPAGLPPQLMQMLQAEMARNPRFREELEANPEETIANLLQPLMQGGGMPGMGGGQPVPQESEMSEEEKAAIERLVALGFDKPTATQAYFACGKNEEMAANVLFEGGADDDMPMQD